MKQLMHIFAGIGLMIAGIAATPADAEAQPRYHAGRYDDGPRTRHHQDRRWDDRRWDDRRGWNDRRGYDRRRDDRRRWDRSGYRGERIIPGWSREAAARGVDYRGPCRYMIRNGRRVCG